jgi:hypothetical protein
MNDELERMWKWSQTNLWHYPAIYLDGQRKTTKSLSDNNRFSDLNLNLGPPEYEAGLLTTRP